MVDILTFDQALGKSSGAKRHVLLGNGFSRACRNDLFAYDALYTQASEKLSDQIRSAFDALGTTDFELVMRALLQASDLVKLYDPSDTSLDSRLQADAETLRDVLAAAIAGSHPARPNTISDEEYQACRMFLSHFDTYYSINYDLLLYWTLMHRDVDELELTCNDGFHQPEEGQQEYVVWDIADVGSQNVFYLHGALHVFDAGAEIHKYTWCNTGIPLVDQIRAELAKNHNPVYVAEGSSESKTERIQHSAFLSRGYRSLPSIGGSLFVFGLSLAPNDEHVLRLIEKGKMRKVFVSIFDDPATTENQRIIARALALSGGREDSRRRNPLEVQFFSAESAHVWGSDES